MLTLRVVPRAARDEFAGPYGDAVRVRLKAPPVDGKANKALLKFLAKQFGIPTADAQLLSGLTSRTKRVHLAGVTQQQAMHRLLPG